MNILSKAVATIESADGKDYGPNGGFTAVLSTPSLDRDGDSLKRHEWIEPLPESVPLDVDHGMSVATTVGSFRPFFDGEKMMMEAHFSSLKQAQDVRTLVDEGHIRTVSVAFMNDRKALKAGAPHRELLNAGIVAIPSNRDAVITHSKALDTRAAELVMDKVDLKDLPTGFILDGLIKSIEEKAAPPPSGGNAPTGNDNALLQAIHDASVHLGAQCQECDQLHASDMPAQPAAPAAPAKPAPKAPAKSTDESEVETKTATLEVDIPEGMSEEDFRARLEELLKPASDEEEAGTPQEETETESPAETEEPAPADEAAAASEEEAAEPVAEESEVAVDEQDLFLEFPDMFAFALTSDLSD
jgi:hypothetical protein